MPRAAPAYTRLDVDERRRRLLALGADLFTRTAYDELSMAEIARAAGISKALLYHYFPSKQAYFQATLEQAAAELAQRVRPGDADVAPVQQLTRSLDAFLGWIEENENAYRKLMQSVASVPAARELVERVRHETADLILAGLVDAAPPPELRTAVRAWLWFMDGACLEWLEHRDLERPQLLGLLLGTLLGAVTASGHHELLARVGA